MIGRHEQRRIAVAAYCDPRTIDDYLTGRRRSQSTTIARIESALRELGREDLIRSDASDVEPAPSTLRSARP